MDAIRPTAATFAAGRIAFGVGLIVAPERVAGAWLGSDAARGPGNARWGTVAMAGAAAAAGVALLAAAKR